MTQQNEKFFGRKEELKKLVANILLGKHTLIIGKKGIGKTTFIDQAIAILNGSIHRIDISPTALAREFNDIRLAQRLKSAWKGQIKLIKADLSRTKSNVFYQIIEQLYKNGDLTDEEELVSINPDGTITFQVKNAQQVIIKSVSSPRSSPLTPNSLPLTPFSLPLTPYCFIFDDLDTATPQMIEFVYDILKTPATVIATATPESADAKKLKHIFAIFEKIELKEFDKETATQLIDYFTQNYLKDIEPEKREFLKNEILRTAKGNPTLIKSMLSNAIAQKHLTEEDIKKLRTFEDREYLNLGPFFAFLIGSITIIKILQIGLENRETYILLSVFSFIAYLTIRVFRYFFLFRPQRKK